MHYKLFLKDFIIKNENKNGHILALATVKPKNFIIDSENNILNGLGEIAPVIHLYYRHKNIVLIVFKKYSP